jgi:hypothetical protein
MLVDRDQAEAARSKRIAEDRAHPRADFRRPPGDFAQHQVAGLRILQIDDGKLPAILLLDW